ncbi:MAG: hypothetical protein V1913_03945 [Fibrobacterota bacterium]
MNRFLFLSLLVSIALPALSEPPASGDICFSLYRENRFSESVECLNQRVYAAEGRDTATLVRLYEALGVNYMMLEKKPLAAAAFGRLAALRPDYELDPNAYLPEIVSLFQTVKLENRQRLDALRPAPAPLYHRACRVLPFGAPQFTQRETRKGAMLLALQAVALGVSIFSYSERNALHNVRFGYAEEDAPAARAWDRTYKITFITFAGAWLYSVVDARATRREAKP